MNHKSISMIHKQLRGEFSNTDTLTISHHNFIISQFNIFKFYL